MSGATLLRHWKMLQLVPRYPRRASAKQICAQLRAHGYRITERTVQRDLEKLSASFPLACDDRSKPYGWHWDKGAQLLEIPGMDLSTALTFHFVHEYLEPVLPASVRDNLMPHVEAASRLLDQNAGNVLPHWPEKVVVIPPGQRLDAPRIPRDVMDPVYEAVLRDRQLRLVYRARSNDGEAREYVTHPLGLVLRGSLCYLVASAFDYDDILQLALHRTDMAEVLDAPARRPRGFSLHQFVADGSFDYPIGPRIRLSALFDAAVAYHLTECRLSDDQQVAPAGDGRMRVTATVHDTRQLRWWLLAFGDQVLVERPAALRQEFARLFAGLASRYR
jgi:predicted DNA-binding transcriptional regulator YafY